MRRSQSLVALVALASVPWVAGCAIAPTDDDVGVAQQEQLTPNWHVWRDFTLTFQDSSRTPFATIYIVNRPLGSYATGTEYWYVNVDSLSLLGSDALTIAVTDHDTTTPPADPGYTSEQSFTQPVYPTGGWGTGWTSDPVSGGSLYSGSNREYLRVKTAGTPLNVSNVTWYQVIASTDTPANITPSGTFSNASNVSVPSGYLGYDISQ